MLDWIRIKRMNLDNQDEQLSASLDHYYDLFSQRPPSQDAWWEQRLVVFDTETTGLNLYQDRLLEIGAVVVQRGEIVLGDSFELLIDSEKIPQNDSIRIHGLTPQDIRQRGVSETEALTAFLSYIKADTLVAHHTRFDVQMVEKAVKRKGVDQFFLFNRKIDTADMAWKLDHKKRNMGQQASHSYGLDELCQRFDISTEDRHTAWGDALITAKLFLKLGSIFLSKGKTKLKHITQ